MNLLRYEKLRSVAIPGVAALACLAASFGFMGFTLVYACNQLAGDAPLEAAAVGRIAFTEALREPVDLDEYQANYYEHPYYRQGVRCFFALRGTQERDDTGYAETARLVMSTGVASGLTGDAPIQTARYFLVGFGGARVLWKTPGDGSGPVRGMIRPVPAALAAALRLPDGTAPFYVDGCVGFDKNLSLYAFCLAVLLPLAGLLLFGAGRVVAGCSGIGASRALADPDQAAALRGLRIGLADCLRLAAARGYRIGPYEVERRLWGSKILRRA